jgi:P pilus assembly chaperone PapD
MFQKTTGIALSLISLLALGTTSATAIEVAVSPPRIEVEINGKTRTQSIKIVNFSSKPAEIKAYVRSWTTREDNELQVVESNEQSLDQWIVFTPSRFTIRGNSSQIVRFAIRPKVKPTPGEHRAVLYLEEVPPEENQNQQGVITVARFGVVIYAYAGEIKRVGVLNSVNVDAKPNKVTAVFDVSSTGNAHVRMKGQYAIYQAAKYPGASVTKPLANLDDAAKLPPNVLDSGVLQLSPVLPDSRRKLLLSIIKKLPPGNYVLDINGDLSGTPIDKGITFTVPAATRNAQPRTKPVTSSKK